MNTFISFKHKVFPLIVAFAFLLSIHYRPYLHAENLQRPKTDANIFGHIIHSETGEHVPFINLIIEGTRIGTITDVSGHYILTNLPVGQHRLVVQGLGYKTTHTVFEAIAGQTVEVDIEVDPEMVRLEEIVITSSPTQSGFRYQPDQVFSGEAIQRRSEASFGEMLNTAPGVSMRSMGSAPARPVIRGLDGDRILILENGERMGDISETSADHSISLDPLAASRVEVVRGPASLLYGSSALGGVINLMTTDIPDDSDPGSSGIVSLQGASMNKMGAGFGRYTFRGEKWAASGRLAYRKSGDITTPDGVLDGTSMNNFDGAVGMGFNRPSVSGGFSLSMTGQTYGIPEEADNPGEKVEISMQKQALQGRMNHQKQGAFDKIQLRFNASRMLQQEFVREYQQDQWNEEMDIEFFKLAVSSTLTVQHKPFSMFDRGAIGFNLHGHQLEVEGPEAYTPGEKRLSLGLFTFQEIPLSNIFRFQTGLRIDFQHTSAIGNSLFPDISNNRNALNYSGSIGMNHRPLPRVEVGGQFARSHRNPSVEELFANGPHLGAGVYEIGNDRLKDEIGHGGDFFIRYNGDKIALEAAGFINHFRNFIIFQPTELFDESSGFQVFQYEGDEARLMGGELSLNLYPVDGLNLNTGIDYVHGVRIKNGRYSLPFMPPFRFTANAEYDFGWGWLGAKLHSASSQNRVAPEEASTEGYTLIGMVGGMRINASEKHVIIVRVDNLGNVRYKDHLSRIEDRENPMPGRNINLTYRWFF